MAVKTIRFGLPRWKLPVLKKKKIERVVTPIEPPAWGGCGLPPVGCVCEYLSLSSNKWHRCTIRYVGTRWAVFKPHGRPETTRKLCKVVFRKLREGA